MTAYFSCGAGDFIAMESFMTMEQKKEITSFSLFTRAGKWIEELIKLHPIWRELPVFIPMTPKQIRAYGVYSFFSIPKVEKITGYMLDEEIDYSGDVFYPDILTGKRKYTESLFEVDAIPITMVCDPQSHADDRTVKNGRNFTEKEEDIISNRYMGMMLNDDFKELGDGKTSMIEALGYVKGCKYFYGVDSMLSVWAARQDGIVSTVVKSIHPIYYKWQKIYDPFNRIQVVKEIT